MTVRVTPTSRPENKILLHNTESPYTASPTMARTELIIEYVDAPLPEPEPRGGSKRQALFEALGGLIPGGQAIEVNRALKATDQYVYRFRVERGREMRFKIRVSRPGWCRIWRMV
jgi:hypothetical protein